MIICVFCEPFGDLTFAWINDSYTTRQLKSYRVVYNFRVYLPTGSSEAFNLGCLIQQIPMSEKSSTWPMIRIAPGVLKRLAALLQRAHDDTSPTRAASALLAAALDLIESQADTLILPAPIASLRVRLGHKTLQEADAHTLQMVLTRLAQLESRVLDYDTARVAEEPPAKSAPRPTSAPRPPTSGKKRPKRAAR